MKQNRNENTRKYFVFRIDVAKTRKYNVFRIALLIGWSIAALRSSRGRRPVLGRSVARSVALSCGGPSCENEHFPRFVPIAMQKPYFPLCFCDLDAKIFIFPRVFCDFASKLNFLKTGVFLSVFYRYYFKHFYPCKLHFGAYGWESIQSLKGIWRFILGFRKWSNYWMAS